MSYRLAALKRLELLRMERDTATEVQRRKELATDNTEVQIKRERATDNQGDQLGQELSISLRRSTRKRKASLITSPLSKESQPSRRRRF